LLGCPSGAFAFSTGRHGPLRVYAGTPQTSPFLEWGSGRFGLTAPRWLRRSLARRAFAKVPSPGLPATFSHPMGEGRGEGVRVLLRLCPPPCSCTYPRNRVVDRHQFALDTGSLVWPVA
jgi:hypothetical protein